eukprot:1001394_1
MRVAGNVARVGGYSLLVFIWIAIFCMYMLYFHNPNLNPVCPPPDLGDRYRIVPDLFDPECLFHSGVPHARASTPFQKMCTVECAPGYRMKRGFRFPEFSGGPVSAAKKTDDQAGLCVFRGCVQVDGAATSQASDYTHCISERFEEGIERVVSILRTDSFEIDGHDRNVS